VELDQFRFDALEKGIDRSEDAPFLMKRLQKVYNKAADISGAEVGEEMLGAVEAAKDLNIPHFFIDVEATPMVSGLLDGMPLSQKLKLAGSVLGASFLPRKHLEKGMEEIQKDPSSAMEKFGKVFPDLKERIVDYRDTYMATKLKQLHRMYPHVVAVVGEGHIKGMSTHLVADDIEVIHLRQVKKLAEKLESGSLRLMEPGDPEGNSKISMEFEVHT
jgi:pheromone shutdown protein TraB